MFIEGLDRTALKLAEVKPMGAVVTLILHPATSL
jgi:hypothetical protein